MATWQHTDIIIDGQPVKAQAPLIIGFSIVYRKGILHGRIHSMA